MKAVFLDLATLGENVSTSNLQQAHADWDFHLQTETDQVLERIADAAILVCNKVVISSETMQHAKSLKLICIVATGTNNVDLAAARDLGIAVTNVTGYGTASVVQHVSALLFALTTNLMNYDRLVLGNKRPHSVRLIFQLQISHTQSNQGYSTASLM